MLELNSSKLYGYLQSKLSVSFHVTAESVIKGLSYYEFPLCGSN